MARLHGRFAQRGVSLIEAMIAMAVMGFGMLAIVGVQTTLRHNADVSKQRSEAVRIAEQEIESVRTFTKVNSGGTAGDEFDAIADRYDPAIVGDNTKFRLSRTVTVSPDNGRRMITVMVSWDDRTGLEQQVTISDMITRVDPMLSGFVRAARPLTALGRRSGRHPTIPASAVNFPGDDKKSVFLPPNGAGAGWIFDNATGAITQTCVSVVDADLVSASALTSKCTPLPHAAQLVSGQIRFNLRGATYNPAGTVVSVMKPAAIGDSAWVIDRATSRLVKICPVPLTAATTDLVASDVTAAGCESADVVLGPYLAADVGDLTPADSEDPQWPTLPATVEWDTSWVNRSTALDSNFDCFADYQNSTLAHADTSTSPARKWINYFCIVKVTGDGWVGRTVVKPVEFTDTFPGGTGGIWKIGTGAGEFRICRYSQAANDYTDNDDHPATYGAASATCTSPTSEGCRPVKSNLINQNFLVVASTKTCPLESTPVDPASGNLVNSNTLQHQPVP